MHLVETGSNELFETHEGENQQYQYNFRYISGYLKFKSNQYLITKQNLEAKRFFFQQETESKSTPLTETETENVIENKTETETLAQESRSTPLTETETEILTENAIEIENKTETLAQTQAETEAQADAEPETVGLRLRRKQSLCQRSKLSDSG